MRLDAISIVGDDIGKTLQGFMQLDEEGEVRGGWKGTGRKYLTADILPTFAFASRRPYSILSFLLLHHPSPDSLGKLLHRTTDALLL